MSTTDVKPRDTVRARAHIAPDRALSAVASAVLGGLNRSVHHVA